MLITNKMLAANKIGGVEDGDKLIKKYGKLSKTEKLFKSQKLAKSRKKSSKSGNLLILMLKRIGQAF